MIYIIVILMIIIIWILAEIHDEAQKTAMEHRSMMDESRKRLNKLNDTLYEILREMRS